MLRRTSRRFIFGASSYEGESLLSHNAQLNVLDDTARPIRNARLVCTIGPASNNVDTLCRLIRTGMNVARLNFSHGTHEYHLASVKAVREAASKFEQTHVAIALDTKGPEIRLGSFADPETKTQELAAASGRVHFHSGQKVAVTTDEAYRNAMTSDRLFVDYRQLATAKDNIPTKLLIADGVLELDVLSRVSDTDLECEVASGEASITSRSNVHVPGVETDLPAISEKDMRDLEFAVEHGLDFVFASFARNADHIKSIREHLLRFAASKGNNNNSSNNSNGCYPNIIAKIENFEGLENLNEIMTVSDGVMVARGDLGVDLPVERVFLAQKKITSVANLAGKPVICATQMLESMRFNPRPTRAEAADVANAVIDGADAVMLSAETASGQFPVESLTTLNAIAMTSYNYIRHRRRLTDMISNFPRPSTIDSTAAAAVLLAQQNNAKCILTLTLSGNSVRQLRKYSPPCPIVAVCATAERARSLALVRGVIALHFDGVPYDEFDRLMDLAIDFLMVTKEQEQDNTNKNSKKKRPALPERNNVAGGGLSIVRGDTVVISCTDATTPQYGITTTSKSFETFVRIHRC